MRPPEDPQKRLLKCPPEREASPRGGRPGWLYLGGMDGGANALEGRGGNQGPLLQIPKRVILFSFPSSLHNIGYFLSFRRKKEKLDKMAATSFKLNNGKEIPSIGLGKLFHLPKQTG